MTDIANGDWLIGMDLGKRRDPAALVLASRQEKPEGYYYEVRMVHEFPLNTSYPVLARALEFIVSMPAFRDRIQIVVDHTGVGSPFVDFAREYPTLTNILYAIWFSAGKNDTQKFMDYVVPKMSLITTLLLAAQKKLVGVSPGCWGGETLKRQLLRFVAKRTEHGNTTMEAEEERDHDDTVAAISCLVWIGGQIPLEAGPIGNSGFSPYNLDQGNQISGLSPNGTPEPTWRQPATEEAWRMYR